MGDLNKPNINIGMLAHVDAGKTTLSEALLYKTGTIRKLGRVDTRDAFWIPISRNVPAELRYFQSRLLWSLKKLVSRFLTPQDMLIFLLKWKEHSRFSTMQSS